MFYQLVRETRLIQLTDKMRQNKFNLVPNEVSREKDHKGQPNRGRLQEVVTPASERQMRSMHEGG